MMNVTNHIRRPSSEPNEHKCHVTRSVEEASFVNYLFILYWSAMGCRYQW